MGDEESPKVALPRRARETLPNAAVSRVTYKSIRLDNNRLLFREVKMLYPHSIKLASKPFSNIQVISGNVKKKLLSKIKVASFIKLSAISATIVYVVETYREVKNRVMNTN